MSQFTGREARLKPEFAHVYPPLEAGKWEPAGVLADKVTAWLLRQAHGGDGPARKWTASHTAGDPAEQWVVTGK